MKACKTPQPGAFFNNFLKGKKKNPLKLCSPRPKYIFQGCTSQKHREPLTSQFHRAVPDHCARYPNWRVQKSWYFGTIYNVWKWKQKKLRAVLYCILPHSGNKLLDSQCFGETQPRSINHQIICPFCDHQNDRVTIPYQFCVGPKMLCKVLAFSVLSLLLEQLQK